MKLTDRGRDLLSVGWNSFHPLALLVCSVPADTEGLTETLFSLNTILGQIAAVLAHGRPRRSARSGSRLMTLNSVSPFLSLNTEQSPLSARGGTAPAEHRTSDVHFSTGVVRRGRTK